MSEERRKRQQERTGRTSGNAKFKKLGGWAIFVGLIAIIYSAIWYHRNHRYDDFARCLASKQAKMYGLYWCPHCLDQKEMFGRSFRYVPYQECAIKGSRDVVPECKVAGAAHFPSWQFAGGPLHEGVLSMEDLSGRTGCSLP